MDNRSHLRFRSAYTWVMLPPGSSKGRPFSHWSQHQDLAKNSVNSIQVHSKASSRSLPGHTWRPCVHNRRAPRVASVEVAADSADHRTSRRMAPLSPNVSTIESTPAVHARSRVLSPIL